MNLAELRRLLDAIDRADKAIDAEKPETAIMWLNPTEQELIRAAIRSVMIDRRDNMIDRLRKEKLKIEEAV